MSVFAPGNFVRNSETGEIYKVTSVFQQPGGFMADPTVVRTINHGDVVEHIDWPGYLWSVESMTDQVPFGRALIRLEILLPPPYVPWKNAPSAIKAVSSDIEEANAMEVLGRMSARDDSKRGKNKRAKSYKKVMQEIRRLRKKLKNSKRPRQQNKALVRLTVLGATFTEATRFHDPDRRGRRFVQ